METTAKTCATGVQQTGSRVAVVELVQTSTTILIGRAPATPDTRVTSARTFETSAARAVSRVKDEEAAETMTQTQVGNVTVVTVVTMETTAKACATGVQRTESRVAVVELAQTSTTILIGRAPATPDTRAISAKQV